MNKKSTDRSEIRENENYSRLRKFCVHVYYNEQVHSVVCLLGARVSGIGFELSSFFFLGTGQITFFHTEL